MAVCSGMDPARTTTTATCYEIACLAVLEPVCGSDGVTYMNECELRVKQCERPGLTVASYSECSIHQKPTWQPGTVAPQANATCDLKCTREYDPQCASNGETFANPCELAVARCQRPGTALELQHVGKCPKAFP
ncbi:TPA: hypothetical protein N0F65_002426 [Lagenidium giganteum]|uniref:Kazal-like domain-containing protein n=1 Tax=Lagenidium giganteum TaxID=4803 RepID=A0AAV2YPM5_9STRA|nr:TPA: hypothetical protein N0F65_002426 [Lagenidium giganteum]